MSGCLEAVYKSGATGCVVLGLDDAFSSYLDVYLVLSMAIVCVLFMVDGHYKTE